MLNLATDFVAVPPIQGEEIVNPSYKYEEIAPGLFLKVFTKERLCHFSDKSIAKTAQKKATQFESLRAASTTNRCSEENQSTAVILQNLKAQNVDFFPAIVPWEARANTTTLFRFRISHSTANEP